MSVNQHLADSLDRLNRVIESAEKKLAGMPAAGEVLVAVDDDPMGEQLMFYDGRLRVGVVGDDSGPRERICDLTVPRRRDVAECIPLLIEAARIAEEGLAGEIDELASRIEAAVNQ